jgi:hypothetical protein
MVKQQKSRHPNYEGRLPSTIAASRSNKKAGAQITKAGYCRQLPYGDAIKKPALWAGFFLP